MSEEATLVDSGSFRVDRKQALDKLMRFQLFDARMYLLPWVQAAVASKATRIWITSAGGSLDFLFDGRPWEQAELKDPYRFLFEEDPGGVYGRNRDLAIGILSALRLKPQSVLVSFSDGKAAYGLRIADVTRETLDASDGDRLLPANNPFGLQFRMAIRVALEAAGELELLEKLCRYCPIPIEWPHGMLHPAEEDPSRLGPRPRMAFSADGISGELLLSPEALEESSIDFVTNGVTVSTEKLRLPAVQVVGHVRNDLLRKSISQAGIVKDENYQKSVALVQKESEKFLLRSLAEAAQAAPAVGAALDEQRFRWHWMPWEAHTIAETMLFRLLDPLGEEDGRQDGATGYSGATSDKSAAVQRMSLIVAAARASCMALKIEMLKREGTVPNALWDAPLLFDTAGQPLTLRALEEQRLWLGHVPCAEQDPGDGAEKVSVALLLRDADRRFLEEFFGSEARQVRSSSDEETPRIKPVLEEPNLLVKLPFRQGSAVGEVGLSLTPHTRASRIRWIREGRPLAIGPWPMGGLRLEVVVDSLALRSAPQPGAVDQAVAQCLSAIVAAAPEAYRRLCAAYDPSSAVPRQAIIREHLLDLAVISWDASRDAWITNDWLEGLALLREPSGRMVSLRDIRAAAAGGQRLLLSASSHPDSLQEMTEGYPEHVKALLGTSKLIAGIAPRPSDAAPAPPLEKPRRPAAAAAPAPPPAPASPPAPSAPRPVPAEQPEPDLIQDPAQSLKRWLRALSARKACPLPMEEIRGLRFSDWEGQGLIRRDDRGAWILNTAHPMARMLAASGGLEENLPYLVSLVYTALNRQDTKLTDDDDMRLQMALTEYLLQGDDHGQEKAPE